LQQKKKHMKKIILILAAVAGITFSQNSFASYYADETSIDLQLAVAEDVSISAFQEATAMLSAPQAVAGDKTVGGFLIRAYFCGGFALHRYYMGTGGKALFWYYFCIPVVGSFTACVDFWYVVFKGKEALNKYADNSKFWVWN
jgi:TM2 domain-containing membrane protein YozV